MQVARSAGCLDEVALEKLTEIRAELEKHRTEGMTPKNMKLIRQVLNGEVWERVVNYPTALMKRAQSVKDRPIKAAVTAQIAVAIAILTTDLAFKKIIKGCDVALLVRAYVRLVRVGRNVRNEQISELGAWHRQQCGDAQSRLIAQK